MKKAQPSPFLCPPTPYTHTKFVGFTASHCLQNGATPAFIAAENGHVEVLALLRDAGADLNAPHKVKAQPLPHPLALPVSPYPLYTRQVSRVYGVSLLVYRVARLQPTSPLKTAMLRCWRCCGTPGQTSTRLRR